MTPDEAASAIRHARAGWTIPEFLKTEAIAALCAVVLDKKSSSRDMLRAIETLLAIERLNIDLDAAKATQPGDDNGYTINIVEMTSEEWKQCKEGGIKPQELLGTKPLPPAPPPPKALQHEMA